MQYEENKTSPNEWKKRNNNENDSNHLERNMWLAYFIYFHDILNASELHF
jgi:hypothetical protein